MQETRRKGAAAAAFVTAIALAGVGVHFLSQRNAANHDDVQTCVKKALGDADQIKSTMQGQGIACNNRHGVELGRVAITQMRMSFSNNSNPLVCVDYSAHYTKDAFPQNGISSQVCIKRSDSKYKEIKENIAKVIALN